MNFCIRVCVCVCVLTGENALSLISSGPLPEIIFIANLRLAASRICIYAKPEIRFWGLTFINNTTPPKIHQIYLENHDFIYSIYEY